jgi:hypothetical protein
VICAKLVTIYEIQTTEERLVQYYLRTSEKVQSLRNYRTLLLIGDLGKSNALMIEGLAEENKGSNRNLQDSFTQLRIRITSIMDGHSSRDLLRLEVPNFDDGYSCQRSQSPILLEFEEVSPVGSPSRKYQDRLILPLG